jgi:hypothetical protein
MTHIRTWGAAAVLLTVLAVPANAWVEVPVNMQMPLFANIWKLDRTFKPRSSQIVIAVLFQANNTVSSEARESAFSWVEKTGGMRMVDVTMDRPGWEEALLRVEADVFYVTPMRGANIERVASIARARQIRTMAGMTEYLKHGLSVGISVRNDRPLIVIDLEAARAEGASYQAQLLKLAEVVNR